MQLSATGAVVSRQVYFSRSYQRKIDDIVHVDVKGKTVAVEAEATYEYLLIAINMPDLIAGKK